MYRFLILPLIAAAMASCTGVDSLQKKILLDGPIRVRENKFTDIHGREVIFHGINLVNKNPAVGYAGGDDEATIRRLAGSGFNCIRLGIFWDAIEPQPGVYNEAYLDTVAKRIDWACESGIYVLLDMHQDLYARKYSDGAPDWATLDEDLPHYTGPVWSDSYLISPAVQRAFDHFWDNSPASDGVGLQDHYAEVWRRVAERFSGIPCVLGYDLMNEPFPGSEAAQFFPMMIQSYAANMYEEGHTDLPSPGELAEIWGSEEGRVEVMKNLESAGRFAAVIDAIYEPNSRFEREKLQPFYQKVALSIRTVDTASILFLEHSYFCNSGVRSAISGLYLPDGSADTQVAYAPHGYDPLTDTKGLGVQRSERIEFIFSRIAETARDLGMPVIVGEWGALGGTDPAHIATATTILNQFGRHGFGHTYWAWYRGVEQEPYFQHALIRPWPVAINGASSTWNHADRSMECSWSENPEIQAPALFFIPASFELVPEKIRISPEGSQYALMHHAGSQATVLVVYPSGKAPRRELFISF